MKGQQIRINVAKDLLRNPSMRIGNIAEEVGFIDMAHFSRVFKKYTGLTPKEFERAELSKMKSGII